MDRYDEIYVPQKDGPYVINTSWGQFDTVFAESKEDVIVMRMQELADMWIAAYARGIGSAGNSTGRKNEPDFDTYMKSKNIQI